MAKFGQNANTEILIIIFDSRLKKYESDFWKRALVNLPIYVTATSNKLCISQLKQVCIDNHLEQVFAKMICVPGEFYANAQSARK